MKFNRDGYRVCPKCKEEKPLTAEYFHRVGKKDKGFSYQCKPCNRARLRKAYHDYKKKHGEPPDREGERRRHLKRKYGLTPEDVPSECQLCGEPEWREVRGNGKGRICVDHCHDSGKVRGFLCYDCNLAIGHARNDSKLLRSMADYLEKV